MAERMGMNVRQIVFLTELIQPICNTIRMHALAIIFGENISGINPTITIEQAESSLFQCVFLQKGQTLRGKLNGTDLSVFGRAFVDSFFLSV